MKKLGKIIYLTTILVLVLPKDMNIGYTFLYILGLIGVNLWSWYE